MTMVAINPTRRRQRSISRRGLLGLFSAFIVAIITCYVFFVGSVLNKHNQGIGGGLSNNWQSPATLQQKQSEEEEVVEPTVKPTIGIPTIAFASLIKALAKKRFGTNLTQKESFTIVKELEATYKDLVK